MGFQQGLSGLSVSSKALDAIGNNVANANTVGFKQSTVQFADVYAASLSGGGGSQVGIGSTAPSVAQLFTQGNITTTNNPLDMAINGSGFYRMATSSGTVSYSRSGQFNLDKNGFIVNPSGLQLTGYAADPITGTISPGSLIPLQVLNSNITPKATTASSMQLNLDSRALPPSTMTSGSLTGATALTGATTIDATNDTLSLIIDGNTSSPLTVTIPHGSYTLSEFVPQLQSMINSALTGTGASVTVSSGSNNNLVITSDSKGTLGSAGNGSSVALNGNGGTAANALFGEYVLTSGTATTPASFTSGANLPSSVTTGTAGESFDLTYTTGGVPTTKTISLPANTPYTDATLVTALQSAIDTAFAPAGTLVVTGAAGGKLSITEGAAGAGDTITVGALSSGMSTLIGPGPTAVAGADNFNVVSAASMTSGTATGGIVLTTPTITTGTNDGLDVTVDGTTVSVTLAGAAAPGLTYDGTAGKTLTDLATDIQTKINQALPASSAGVTVTVNSSNELVITSNSTGSSSSVTGVGGTAASTLFADPNATPATAVTYVAGTQTQTINPQGFTASTAQTVYDSQGNPHNLSLYFVKASEPNVWQMYSTLDNGQQQGPVKLNFGASGALQTPMPLTLPATGNTYTFTASPTNASQPTALSFTLDLSGTTQYGVNFGVNTLSQDGYSSGQLSGISVGSDGIIQGRFSNGQSKNMGQIVLVNFNNPNGLQSLGNNQWAETTESGQPIPGTPGTGSLGSIQSAAVEESNVDLTAELVNMITQQRVYQANAQTIKTQDQVLQTLVNLR